MGQVAGIFGSAGILVCSGCRSKRPYAECLKQQKVNFSQFQSLETQDEGAGRVGFW